MPDFTFLHAADLHLDSPLAASMPTRLPREYEVPRCRR